MELNQILDRRLNGQEACTPEILLVIDELARLTRMECFDVLINFLERCTEETRKANMTFIGGSHSWTARHFNGRADIRRCINSLLIHKTKPSQAELLLEDTHDKQLVKQLQHPGDAILATDYGMPTVITLPLCTLADMHTVARMVNADKPATPESELCRATGTEDPVPLFRRSSRRFAGKKQTGNNLLTASRNTGAVMGKTSKVSHA